MLHALIQFSIFIHHRTLQVDSLFWVFTLRYILYNHHILNYMPMKNIFIYYVCRYNTKNQ